MTADSDTKSAVLRGVYEDNLDLPRTSIGKRRSAPPAPERDPGAPWRGWSRMALALVVAAMLLVGVELRIGMPGSLATAPEPLRSGPALAGSEYASGYPVPMAPAEAIDSLLAATNPAQYDAMLGDLDMSVAELFDLGVHTVVIDPGHGGRDPGSIARNGLQEKDVALDIARRLRDKLLAVGGYRVLLTRDDDVSVRLKERVAFATENDADLFVSIHINAVPVEAGPFNYVETYYFGASSDLRTLDLARHENRGSDYGMRDFPDVIERIRDTVKSQESARLASAIHRRLFTNLKRVSSNLTDAGVKPGPFVVLLGNEVPSVLVEVSCISNEQEAARLEQPQYRDQVAQYLKVGIVDYLDQRAARTQPEGVREPYVVQQSG